MFEHLAYNELDELWTKIHTQLIAPFPPGSIQFKDEAKKKAYIHAKVYVKRLNDVAGPVWSWRITSQRISSCSNFAEVNGVLRILHREAEGQGWHRLEKRESNGMYYNYENAFRSAASDALRNACDFLEMGWVDLAPFRDWKNNPGILDVPIQPDQSSMGKALRVCKKCQAPLSERDEELLVQLKVPVPWCEKDIPDHMKKKLQQN
ncbi:hypothetical protein ACFYU8_17715 [Brevibacillus sp. NPDC003359]|uniref:hypothetical protein n=1 Tax=unclassified Brevibacillus TaxID=2684853 RepID=UPI0036A9F676